VLAYHCVIGISSSLEEKGVIFRCHLDFTSNYSFIVTMIEQQEKGRILKPADMQRYALKIKGKSDEAAHFSGVEGFFAGWVEGGLTQPEQHNLVKSLAQGAAYAFAGAMGTAANILDH